MTFYNAIRTPDGTVIESTDRYHFNTHLDAITNQRYFVDGGCASPRHSSYGDEVDLSVTSDSPHSLIREHFSWGTYGKDGTEPYRRVLLKDMSTDHILAIITDNCYKSSEPIFIAELAYRGLSYPELSI